jgi:hypothetical protein
MQCRSVLHMEAAQGDLVGVWHFKDGQQPQLLPFNSSEASHAAHVPPHDDPGLESFFIPGPLANHFCSSFSPILQDPSIQAPSSQTTLLDSIASLQGPPKNISGCYLMKSQSQPQFLSFLELIPAETVGEQPATEDAMAGLQAFFFLSPEESVSAVAIMNAVRQEQGNSQSPSIPTLS